MDTSDTVYRVKYESCPVCAAVDWQQLGDVDCSAFPLDTGALPRRIRWVRCQRCSHIHSDSYYNEAGLKELFREANQHQLADPSQADQQRMLWADVVARVVACLPDLQRLWQDQAIWLDVGCGAGGLVATASEFGFKAIGLDLREEAVNQLQALGYSAVVGDIANIELESQLDVISLADVLEHMAYPLPALSRSMAVLRPGGVLLVSCPNTDCLSWQVMDKAGTNPYWAELEHHHNFSRRLLSQMLVASGFELLNYQVSRRYKCGMELLARKPAQEVPVSC